MKSGWRLEAELIHGGEPRPGIAGAVNVPVFLSSTYEFTGESDYHHVRYIRLNNTPNHVALHQKLATLERGEAALVAGSGMAAISATLLSLLAHGDQFLAHRSLFGPHRPSGHRRGRGGRIGSARDGGQAPARSARRRPRSACVLLAPSRLEDARAARPPPERERLAHRYLSRTAPRGCERELPGTREPSTPRTRPRVVRGIGRPRELRARGGIARCGALHRSSAIARERAEPGRRRDAHDPTRDDLALRPLTPGAAVAENHRWSDPPFRRPRGPRRPDRRFRVRLERRFVTRNPLAARYSCSDEPQTRSARTLARDGRVLWGRQGRNGTGRRQHAAPR